MNKAWWFYYLTKDQHVVRIWARKRPSHANRISNGPWVVRQFVSGVWVAGAFAYTNWYQLKDLTYIGKTAALGG